MRIVHLAALIAAAGRVAPQSPPDIPKIGPTATLLALKQPDRAADRASCRLPGPDRLLHTFDYGQPCKSEASYPPHSARYLEARFETIAVVGHLSQSNWTGRAFGRTKP